MRLRLSHRGTRWTGFSFFVYVGLVVFLTGRLVQEKSVCAPLHSGDVLNSKQNTHNFNVFTRSQTLSRRIHG